MTTATPKAVSVVAGGLFKAEGHDVGRRGRPERNRARGAIRRVPTAVHEFGNLARILMILAVPCGASSRRFYLGDGRITLVEAHRCNPRKRVSGACRTTTITSR